MTSVVGTCAARSMWSMHISESEKLENERVGRTLGRSVTEACSMKGWSRRGSMGVLQPLSSAPRASIHAVMYRRGLGMLLPVKPWAGRAHWASEASRERTAGWGARNAMVARKMPWGRCVARGGPANDRAKRRRCAVARRVRGKC